MLHCTNLTVNFHVISSAVNVAESLHQLQSIKDNFLVEKAQFTYVHLLLYLGGPLHTTGNT